MTTTTTIRIRTITESGWKEILAAVGAAEASAPAVHNRALATQCGDELIAELRKRAIARELQESDIIGKRYVRVHYADSGFMLDEWEVSDINALFCDPRWFSCWREIENSAIIIPDDYEPEDGIIDWLERTGIAPERDCVVLEDAIDAGGDDGVASGDAITLRSEPTRWMWCDDATFPYEDSIDDIVALVPDAGHQGHYALRNEVR